MPPSAALAIRSVANDFSGSADGVPVSPPSGALPGAVGVVAAVRDRAQQAEAIDALLAQEIRRVTLLFLQQEHQQRAAFDLLRARRGRVHHRALDDAIETERRFRLDRLAAGHRREGAVEHFFEIAAQLRRG